MPTSDTERVAGEEAESPGDLHQALLREVNDRIERLNREWELGGSDTVLCECGHPDCVERIDVAAEDYERLRRFATRFIVQPNHVTSRDERIVEERQGYVVVEKVGAGALTAIRLDPRRRPSRRTRSGSR